MIIQFFSVVAGDFFSHFDFPRVVYSVVVLVVVWRVYETMDKLVQAHVAHF